MRASSRSFVGALVACGTIAAAASAQPLVDVPPECGTADEYQRQLSALLGDRVDEGWPRSVRISAPDEAGHRTLTLEVSGETRELRDPDCRALFRSAVVIAAVAVRPELADPVRASEPQASPASRATKSVRSAPAESQPAPAPRSALAPRWHSSLYFGTGAALGVLPRVAPLLELGATAETGEWGVLAAVRYLPWGREEGEDGRGVKTWAIGGQVAALFAPVDLVRVSAGVAAYRLQGEGVGISEPLTDSVGSVAPGIEVALVPFRTDAIRLELGIQAYVSVLRPRFEIGGVGEIYRVPPFGGAVAARVAWLP